MERKVIGGFEFEREKSDAKGGESDAPLIHWSASGFLLLEHERSKRFGYDVGTTSPSTTAISNFQKAPQGSRYSVNSFTTHAQFEASREPTKMVALLKVGSTLFGDTNSGGAQGTREKTIEVRNLYLNHEFSSVTSASGGMQSLASDPRAFIFSDQVAAVALGTKWKILEGNFWIGDAAKSRPAQSTFSKDRYYSLLLGVNPEGRVKGSLFGVHRQLANEQFAVDDGTGTGTYTTGNGNAVHRWLGGQVVVDIIEPLNLELNYIYNKGKTKLPEGYDNLRAFLFDVKSTYQFEKFNTKLSLEWLKTPGQSDVVESTTNLPYLDKRRNFISPVGTSYLLTVATSDGFDDAPGVNKQSAIAPLSLAEGLKILVASVELEPLNKWKLLCRYGDLRSSVTNQSTRGNKIGREADIQLTYQYNQSVEVIADYGRFYPGNYFPITQQSFADLFSARVKYSF